MKLSLLTLLAMFFSVALAQHQHAGTPPQNVELKKTEVKKVEIKKTEEPRVPVSIPLEQQKKIGLKTSLAEKKKGEYTIRTVGTVTADQTKEAHVHTKINGWIENIFADYVGKPVKKGQTLFELYSPDLVSTQEEYLSAKRMGEGGKEIAKIALERLKLWGVANSEISRLVKTGVSKRTLAFDSPVNGFIVNKNAIKGMYITPEMELYHIADLSKVWIIVTLYEYDVSLVNTSDVAEIELPFEPGKSFKGKISYVYPEIELETRTAKARIETDNPGQKFKPGMFANIIIKKNIPESISIPEDSVIDTGLRKIVFVKTNQTQFEPREIKIGPRMGNTFVVLSGLKEGEEIVTSAHFLIDAESKFQAAVKKGTPSGGHSGHGGK